MSLIKKIAWAFFVISGVVFAEATDLNVPAAQAKYDAAKLVADRAQAKMQDREREFRRLEGAYYDSVSREEEAQRKLNNEQYNLERLDQLIRNLEDRIATKTREIKEGENKLILEQNALASLERDRQRLEIQIEDVRHEIRHVDDALAAENAKPEPNPSVIQNLQNQHGQLERELNALQAQASQLDQSISKKNHTIAQIKIDLNEDRYNLQQAQTQLNQANRDRQNQLFVLQNAREALLRAQNEVRYAKSRMESARSEFQFAEAEYQREAAIAQKAYDYLQQVIANYQYERERVIALATKAGQSHGGREGSERADSPGAIDGAAKASEIGKQVGSEEGARRDYARGYREGREIGAQLVPSSFQEGMMAGRALALDKAKQEEFPRGYNDALKALFVTAPEQESTIDISEQLPGGEGGAGSELSPTEKAVGSVAAPVFGMVQEPLYVLPVAGTVSAAVPQRDKRYFSPACQGMALPEFESLCQKVYDDSYSSGHVSQYRSRYNEVYQKAFAANVKAAYDVGLSLSHPESREQGLKVGAKEGGILTGFGESLSGAQAAQYVAGKRALQELLATGYLPVVRLVEFVESNRDGLFTPGEKVSVRMVVDNYGQQESPAKRYRLRVTGKKGVETISTESRELPAIPGNTRTTIEGVITATIASLPAKQKLGIEGVIEGGTLAYGFSTEKEAHFPLELESIALAKKPMVNEKVAAVFRFRNMTEQNLPETKLGLSTKPAIVAVEPLELQIPKSMAQEVVEVSASVKPGSWVGENTYVPFLSRTENISGIEAALQPFPYYMAIERSGVLLIFDEAGRPVPNSTLVVKAGSRVGIQAQFKFLSTQALRGPFIVKAESKSQSSITHTSGTTVSVNYGSVRPGTVYQNVRFYYEVPASLKGRTEWVMIVLYEGNKVLHAAQLYLDIK